MGDARFSRPYEQVRLSDDPVAELRALSDEEVVQALAHASMEQDAYLANVICTEALNRLAERKRWLDIVEAFYFTHDNLGVGLVIVDGARIEYANDAFRAMMGRTLEELHDERDLLDLALPEDRPRITDVIAPALRAGTAALPERVRLRHRDGRALPVRLMVARVGPPDRQARRFVCVVLPAALD